MRKKFYSVISVLIIVAMICSGCATERIKIEKPSDGWYGKTEHKITSYETIREHNFQEEKLLEALNQFSDTLKIDGKEKEILSLYKEIIDETNSLGSAMVLLDISYNSDIRDESIANARIELNEKYQKLMDKVYLALQNGLKSSYGEILEKEILTVTNEEEVSKIKKYQVKTEDDMALISREQELVQKYDITLLKNVEIELNGERWTAQKLQASPPSDANLQYQVNKALQDEKTKNISEILSELLEVRTKIARANGYENYSDYAYKEIYNRDYTPKDIKNVYASVKKYFVPLYEKIQKHGSNIDFSVLSNTEKKSDVELLNAVKPYFEKIDSELSETFELLSQSHTYDLSNKKGKSGIAFATKIFSYDIPFLFISPIGYVQDSTTLIHELGHYNAMLHSKQPMLFEGKNHDVAEINSQGLELLFLEYADEMWKDAADAIRFNTIMKICSSVIEGCLYDEFQNEMYKNPDMTSEEMNELYSKLCKEYGIKNKGKGDWIYINHTFSFPLYYISYATSGLSALDLYIESTQDRESAVNRYMALSAIGMTGSYKESIEKVGLLDIFKSGSIKEIAKSLEIILNLK